MKKYKSITVENILYFKKAKFVFKPGITFIRGLNLNGDGVSGSTNGVGKSLLFSCIPNILYCTTPLAKKNDKKALFGKNSSITFDFKDGKTNWSLVQRSNGKNVGYDVYRNGENIKPRTNTIAETKIKELFDISEDLFYTKDYISIQRPHMFLRGSNVQRQEFFTEVFGLDQLDKIKVSLGLKVKDLKGKKIKLNTYYEQRATIEELISKIAWSDEKKEKVETLQIRSDKLRVEYSELNNVLTGLTARLSLLKRIKQIVHKLGDNQVADEVILKKKAYKKLLVQLSDYEEYLRALNKYTRNTEELKKRISNLETKIKDCSEDKDISKVRKQIKKLTAQISTLKHDVKTLKQLRSEYGDIAAGIPKGSDLKNYQAEEELVTLIHEYEQLAKLYKALNSTNKLKRCPLCKSDVSLQSIKTSAEKVTQKLPKLNEDLNIVRCLKQLEILQKRAKKLLGCEEQLLELELKLDKLERYEETIERNSKVRSQIKDSKKLLSQIDKPKEVSKPDTSLSSKELQNYISDCNLYLSWIEELEQLQEEQLRIYGDEISISALNKKLERAKDKQEKLNVELREINAELPLLISEQKQLDSLKEQLITIDEKIVAIKLELKDLKVLEALIKAYSSKGLKIGIMKKIATLVEANLNLYRPLIFAEPFKFSISITENKFDVIVDRSKSGAQNKLISDVSKLSGAEGTCFILLLLLSILPLIPQRKRTDTIILDEMTALLGPPLKNIFYTKFLPMLATIVSKVVCIITDTDIPLNDARIYTIQKKGKESTLIESTC